MSWHIKSFATTPTIYKRFVSIQSLTEVLPTPLLSKGARVNTPRPLSIFLPVSGYSGSPLSNCIGGVLDGSH